MKPSAAIGAAGGLNQRDCQGQQNQGLPHLYIHSTEGAPREGRSGKGGEESSSRALVAVVPNAPNIQVVQPSSDVLANSIRLTQARIDSAKQLYITTGDVQMQPLNFFRIILFAHVANSVLRL